MRRLLTGSLAVAAAISALGPATPCQAAGRGASGPQLANGCFALRSTASGRFVVASGDGYRADGSMKAGAAAFFWKPSTLRSYLLWVAEPGDGVGRGSRDEAGGGARLAR